MKSLLSFLLVLLCSFVSFSQIDEEFDSFNGPGEWVSPGQPNSGSHDSQLCFNIVGGYIANEFYVFQSPLYDFSTWNTVELLWRQESNVRPGDIFALYFYDNGWFYYDISNLNGWYGVTLPTSTIALAFVLNSFGGSGNTNGNFSHVEFLSIYDVVPLPVELLDFSAELEGDDASIEWSTASEHNNWYFSIYKSSNGMVWEHEIDIPGTGESTTEVEYEYIDKDVDEGTTYYKLNQIDFDGVSDSFNTVYVYKQRKDNSDQEFYDLSGKKVKPEQKGYMISKDGKIHFKQ